MELKLIANTEEERVILSFLSENASEQLAEKINNGTPYEKDGVTLINKKTLSEFMEYAHEEARKNATKNYACIHSDTMFGWVIHYFEEDSIVGTLYNPDGTKYETPKKEIQKPVTYTPTPKKQAPKPPSFFDLLEDKKEDNNEIKEEQEIVIEQRQEPEIKTANLPPFYQKYLELEKQHPDKAIAFRLGDFYEIIGEKAVYISEKLDLTLTSRAFGEEKKPMVGFPYHVCDKYFGKIIKHCPLVICESENEIEVLDKIPEKELCINKETGEIIDNPLIEKIYQKFGDFFAVELVK